MNMVYISRAFGVHFHPNFEGVSENENHTSDFDQMMSRFCMWLGFRFKNRISTFGDLFNDLLYDQLAVFVYHCFEQYNALMDYVLNETFCLNYSPLKQKSPYDREETGSETLENTEQKLPREIWFRVIEEIAYVTKGYKTRNIFDLVRNGGRKLLKISYKKNNSRREMLLGFQSSILKIGKLKEKSPPDLLESPRHIVKQKLFNEIHQCLREQLRNLVFLFQTLSLVCKDFWSVVRSDEIFSPIAILKEDREKLLHYSHLKKVAPHCIEYTPPLNGKKDSIECYNIVWKPHENRTIHLEDPVYIEKYENLAEEEMKDQKSPYSHRIKWAGSAWMTWTMKKNRKQTNTIIPLPEGMRLVSKKRNLKGQEKGPIKKIKKKAIKC